MSMTMQDYANLGAAALTGNPAYVLPTQGQALHARKESDNLRKLAAYCVPTQENLQTRIDGPSVGWTTPSLSFDKMKQINGSALTLNFDIEKNVTRKEFKDSWNLWFKDWQHFFERYQGMAGKFTSLFDSDAVAAQTESYRVQLMGDPDAKPRPNPGWIGVYEAERTPEGKPVPPSSAAPVPRLVLPPVPGQPPPPEDGLPWWVMTLLVIGGVTFVAGSVFIIRRKLIEAKHAEHMIREQVLPLVLGGAMGAPGVAFAHAAGNQTRPAMMNDPSSMGQPFAGFSRDIPGGVYFVG